MLKSHFPVTFAQMISFQRRYAGKPSLAQENVGELIDVPTTSCAASEAKSLRVLHSAIQKIFFLTKTMRLRVLSRKLERILDIVSQTVKNAKDRTTQKYSGLASKGALILRKEGVDTIIKWCDSAVLIQKVHRGSMKRKAHEAVLRYRCNAAIVLQSFVRRLLAKYQKVKLGLQQYSQYEQIFDERLSRFYWFDKLSGKSTWEEPPIFRPMVRLGSSQQLIQAWPHLNKCVKGSRRAIKYCMFCSDEAATRSCADCPVPSGIYGFRHANFCFACWFERHQGLIENHAINFLICKPCPLSCSMCGNPSTRKCLGNTLSEDTREIIYKFSQEAYFPQCNEILTFNDFLTLMRDTFGLSMSKVKLNTMFNECQRVRGTDIGKADFWKRFIMIFNDLEKHNCGGHFCSDCWVQIHATRSRSQHQFLGYEEMCSVCIECLDAPARKHCITCHVYFCESCAIAFHKTGQRRSHVMDNIKEALSVGQVYCNCCTYRCASHSCRLCGTQLCDSCMQLHIKSCSTESLIKNSIRPLTCSCCENPPDTVCMDCKDVYCSITWLGNKGCFHKTHKSGKRSLHSQVSLADAVLKNREEGEVYHHIDEYSDDPVSAAFTSWQHRRIIKQQEMEHSLVVKARAEANSMILEFKTRKAELDTPDHERKFFFFKRLKRKLAKFRARTR